MDAVPASALQAVLKVPPPLSPMWYCLSKPIAKDLQWIAGHIQELTTAREAFVQKLAFPPKPLQLIDIVANGKRQPPRRKRPAWLLEVQEVRQQHAQLENLAHLLEDLVLHLGTLLTEAFKVQKQMVAAAAAEARGSERLPETDREHHQRYRGKRAGVHRLFHCDFV